MARRAIWAAALAACLGAVAVAQTATVPAPAATPAPAVAEVMRGPVTGLPLPRYVSLKAPRANARRGPGRSHRVDWVFLRRGMPLELIAEHGHWRRVRDPEAATGWLHYSLIRGDRTAIVTAETIDFHASPDAGAAVTARAERGVILDLHTCGPDWCRLSRGRVGGWALKSGLWGMTPAEAF